MGTLHQATIPEETVSFPLLKESLYVSEEEYWETYYEMPDRVYEWNNGILEERPMGDKETFLMYHWFEHLLTEYLETHPMGEMMGMEVGFRLAIPGNTSVRRPDLALILKSNPVQMDSFEHSYRGIFDICFEFVSDSKPKYVTRDTVTKKSEYCRSGVKEYFILDGKGRETAFYRLRGGFYTPILPDPDGLICSGVLPGFQFREEDLYQRPSWNEMAEDPAYRPFVRKDWQKERQRAEKERRQAEKERQRAEKERQRAEKAEQETEKERQRAEKAEQETEKEHRQAERERQRAEKLAAMLRELGIDAD